MTGVTRAQLESLAARAPTSRAASLSHLHPSRRHSPASSGDVLSRARSYLTSIPGAVSGERGHDRTFYAANRLVRGFALEVDAALPLLAEWNTKCVPPWSEYDLRRKLEQAARQSGPRGFLLTVDPPPPGSHARRADAGGACFQNYTWAEITDGETMRRVRRGRGGQEMLDELVAYTGGWPRRMGKMLFARGRNGELLWMKQASELFAWIDWQYRLDGGRGFDWQAGAGCLSQTEFLEACRIHCEDWKQVELYPHEPAIPGHYYFHPEIPSESDGSALSELVRRFSPATPLDDDLIRLLFTSMFWGGLPGKRPIFVIESARDASNGGRGAGKTTLAEFAAELVGGYLSISPSERIEEIHKRLLSSGGLVKRVGLIDNLKSLRFSSSDLEGLITSKSISGRQMFTGEGSRPNTLVWIVTSNMPSLSKDLAQRSVILRVTTPSYDPKWQKSLIEFIGANRWQIVADCLNELRREGTIREGQQFTRWNEWEQDVLAKAPDPAALASELVSRQQLLDDDREIAEEVTEAICDLLRRKGFKPESDCVLIPSGVLFDEIIKRFAGERVSRTSGSKWLYMLGVTSLSKHDASLPYRGGIWRPVKTPSDAKPFNWSDRIGAGGIPE